MTPGLYRVKIRRGLAPVKPEALLLDGRCFRMRPGWQICLDDSIYYVGETAMVWDGEPPNIGAPCWLASGDLQLVDESEKLTNAEIDQLAEDFEVYGWEGPSHETIRAFARAVFAMARAQG